MQRYFFDVTEGSRTEYDYKGRDFLSVEMANQHAELIALDLGLSADPREFPRQEVKMRNVAGALLFAVAVRSEADLLAA